MADPFAAVAESYDIMVDWPARLERERPFFTMLFQDHAVHRVLDVGCGTGHHSRAFAEMGASTIGIDPSQPMIEHARALTSRPNPSFVEGSFDDIDTLPGEFDLIVMLGNALAFVESAAHLNHVLNDCYRKLSAGGRLCIQVVNYDRIMKEGVHRLPLVHRQVGEREYLFLREYRRIGDLVEFSISMLVRDEEWRQGIERARHHPITWTTLEEGLQHAGFIELTAYGDYQQNPFDPVLSPGLVVVAEKGAE